MRKRVLIIHQGALGDVVLSLPALSRLKRQRDVFLSLLCGEQIGRVVQEMGLVDRHYPLESRILSGMFERRWDHETQRFCGGYDRIVVIGFSHALVARLRDDFHGKTHWVTPRPAMELQDHVATHIVNALGHQGLLGRKGNSVRVSLSELVNEDLPGGAGHYSRKQLTILHPGAGSRRKRWDIGGFTKVARAVAATGRGPTVFLIGPAEEELAGLLKAESGDGGAMTPSDLARLSENGADESSREKGFRYICTQDLRVAVSLLSHASGFVGNDSGLTHLSAYLGIPTVALFGPSSPRRWRPLGKRVTVLRGVGDCSPCFETTKDNCAEPRCLSAISPTMILNGLKVVQGAGHFQANKTQ